MVSGRRVSGRRVKRRRFKGRRVKDRVVGGKGGDSNGVKRMVVEGSGLHGRGHTGQEQQDYENVF